MLATYDEFIPLINQLNHADKLRLAQWLINTITTEEHTQNLANSTQDKNKDSLKGVFNQYADTSKIALEKTAWQNHVVNTAMICSYSQIDEIKTFDKKLNRCIQNRNA